MSAAQRASLAVITVTHDSAHVLPSWIDALEAVAPRERLELCVVDSGSSPTQLARSEELARGRIDKFVAMPNVGFGAGCNLGAAATSAPTLLFCNPDADVVSLPPSALDGEGIGDRLIGAFDADLSLPLGFARLPTFREEAAELALGRWSKAFKRSATAPAWVSGAALMVGREAFDRIGGFSPAFFMYFEDADLCARHSCAGGSIELDPDLVVRHAAGQSTEGGQSPIAGAIDGVNRLSGRRFAVRYGRPWDALLLYLLLVFAYLPRRIASIVAHRDPLGPSLDYCADVLIPARGLRRIGARWERRR